ncbi:MAG: hypothetical protein ACI9G1_005770 [Pirellulaceae bacterium]|jgi:hypothetical protein
MGNLQTGLGNRQTGLGNWQTGYCTNVHAGADLQATRANLQQHALSVRDQFAGSEAMGVGLWLSAAAANSLVDDQGIDEFRQWLETERLVPFTMNGFPYGDFHQPVVKHLVYQPTWYEQTRLDYTNTLVDILDQILPAGIEGSISTLPVCWGNPGPSEDQRREAARLLRAAADHMARTESERGRLIYLCIEPEPGCFMDRGEDIVRFFEQDVLPGGNEEIIRRHLRVCHDVCHAAVMFEEQTDVLQLFRDRGLKVGKVQVSSAIKLRLDGKTHDERQAALNQLREFAEDRYLHQTVWRTAADDLRFFEDLPAALAELEANPAIAGEVRVHFHVPIFVENFGHLGTSQQEVIDCIQATSSDEELTHYEVETYAWGVLPEELRQENLAAGIAKELEWFRDLAEKVDR